MLFLRTLLHAILIFPIIGIFLLISHLTKLIGLNFVCFLFIESLVNLYFLFAIFSIVIVAGYFFEFLHVLLSLTTLIVLSLFPLITRKPFELVFLFLT